MKSTDILQSIRQGILVCDRQARVVYCNRAYEEFVGHSLEELAGKPITKFRKEAKVPKVLHTGKAMESIYRTEDAQEYFASIYPIYEEGQLTGTVSTVTPIEIGLLRQETLGLTLKEQTAIFQRQKIEELLNLYGHDLEGKKRAAKELDISLAGLYEKLKE